MPLLLQILLAAFGANLIVGAATQPTRTPPAWYLQLPDQVEWERHHNFQYHLRYGIEAHCAKEIQ